MNRQSLDRPRRVAVLGAGTMGAQIAAHFANVGVPVLLLDQVIDPQDPNRLAREALARFKKLRPAPLFVPEAIELIEIGNFDSDLSRVSDCDWIIEAIAEQLDPKQQLWVRVAQHRKSGTIVSTNTSGLPVAEIASGLDAEFQRHWLGTHFFNPPRYMRLLEVIPGPNTDPAVVGRVSRIGDRLLGKGVVLAKDRPNFIANRIGTFAMARAMSYRDQLDMTFEEIDLLTGPAIGRPKTGTFALADLVGIDVLLHVWNTLYNSLPDDPWHDFLVPHALVVEMVDRGWTGRKAGQGFYKKVGREILTLDPQTLEYRPRRDPDIASLNEVKRVPDVAKRILQLLGSGDRAAQFLGPFLAENLLYSAGRIPEICESPHDIDEALRLGFNWQQGPFELADAVGAGAILRHLSEPPEQVPWLTPTEWAGSPAIYQEKPRRVYDPVRSEYRSLSADPEDVNLATLGDSGKIVLSCPSARLVDVGQGVACFEFNSKLNTIGPDVVEMAPQVIDRVGRDFEGLVIGNQSTDFSAGANLKFLLAAIDDADWTTIGIAVDAFQGMNRSFRESPFPVVGAPFGRVLGGGAEVCLGCNALVASAETYIGLPEVAVGLIPAGGGATEMLFRYTSHHREDPRAERTQSVRQVFELLGMSSVSSSAEEARKMGFLQEQDLVEIQPARLLYRARGQVLKMSGAYQPARSPRKLMVGGATTLATLRVGLNMMEQAQWISGFDALVGGQLANVLSGGELTQPTVVTEDYLYGLEREAFLSLCGEPKTRDRIEHILRTGKPLRN